MTVKKFEHVGVLVKDAEASKEFYGKAMGLSPMDEIIIPNGPKLVFLGLNDSIIIELIELNNNENPSEGVVNHFAFTVENIEEEFKRLQSLDVKLLSDEIQTMPNGVKIFFFEGPDHERLEFYQPAK